MTFKHALVSFSIESNFRLAFTLFPLHKEHLDIMSLTRCPCLEARESNAPQNGTNHSRLEEVMMGPILTGWERSGWDKSQQAGRGQNGTNHSRLEEVMMGPTLTGWEVSMGPTLTGWERSVWDQP